MTDIMTERDFTRGTRRNYRGYSLEVNSIMGLTNISWRDDYVTSTETLREAMALIDEWMDAA